MRVVQSIKAFVPAPLRPPLRRLKQAASALLPKTYKQRVEAEKHIFTVSENIHDLPLIAHYWSTTHLIPILQPFGFTNTIEMFRMYIARVCTERQQETCLVLSIGSGDCASEINIAQWLFESGIRNFTFECMDLNPEVLERGRVSAAGKGLVDNFQFTAADINRWRPSREYPIIMAVQCLHHFVKLERLFKTIHLALRDDGFFLTDDMIGRNGHLRWPEALGLVNERWKELPRDYTYNHILKRYEREYENWDCSVDSFEGIRAQDILPLLVQRFHFDLFIGFGNIVDIFIERTFGPNFDPNREWDRQFIDRLHALDVEEMESGRVKPTHIYAAMTKSRVERPKFHRNLTPEFCIRHPDPTLGSRLRRLFR